MKNYFKGNQYVSNLVVKVKRWFKIGVITLFIAGLLGAGYQIFEVVNGLSKTEYVRAEVQVPVEVKGKVPVMERIAKCESGGKHYGESGQVLMVSNTNKTVDVGKFQINTVWFKKAKELGLDVTKEEDNEKMAYWIYENRGTEDWYASRECWAR